jgi:hypothetical protein
VADPIVRFYREVEKQRDELAHATLKQPPKTLEEFSKAAGRYHGLTECMERAKTLFHADDEDEK